MQYNYIKEMFRGRAKPFRIIGNPDNDLPDKWNLALVLEFTPDHKYGRGVLLTVSQEKRVCLQNDAYRL
jgi:hypothetical protein